MDVQPHSSSLNLGSEPGDAASILRRAQRGNQLALRQLVQQHQARVFGIALRLTGRHQDAEELAQDVFVQMYGALAGMASPAHLTGCCALFPTDRSIAYETTRDMLRLFAGANDPVVSELFAEARRRGIQPPVAGSSAGKIDRNGFLVTEGTSNGDLLTVPSNLLERMQEVIQQGRSAGQ
jgi:hypothetical protein